MKDTDREVRRKEPITVYRGEPLRELLFQPLGESGAAVDPSNWDIQLQLYRTRDQESPDLSATLADGQIVVDDSFNILLVVDAAGTQGLGAWRYEMVIRIDDGANPFWYVTGEAIVKDKLTL